ncbi:CBS domain-containing protein [Candidatus Bathyarchaeota archaeon]|nr:CBS domain-containing protein [Candidatus Bathyarchaeota archaeon]
MTERRDLGKDFPTISDRVYREFKKFKSVSEIMSKDVVTISATATMAEAAKIMGEKHIGSLIILEDDQPKGIVTESDLLSKVISKGSNPAKVKVKNVLSSPVISIKPSITIKEAARAMIEKRGRLVVLRDGKIVGIVTAADLIKSLPDAPETELNVDKVMTGHITSVDESVPVAEAAKIMGEQRIGSVIVDRKGKHFGIFTERDLLTTFLAKGRPLETKVGESASHPLVSIPLGSSIHETAMMMAKKHVRRLPVTDKGKIVGIVTARDLVEAYAK